MKAKKLPDRKYTRKQLEEIKNSETAQERRGLIQELVQRAGDGAAMSLAEKDYAYRIIRISFNADTGQGLNIDDFPSLEEYHFKDLYRHYNSDLEGRYGITDFRGIISIAQKKVDVQKLNQIFLQWKTITAKENHKEDLLNRVCVETRLELKQLNDATTVEGLDFRTVSEKEKSIVLHARYLYLIVKEFFDEHEGKPVVAKFYEKEIEINHHSLAHIMSRHYAGAVKQFDTKKSFHFDASIDFRMLPFVLKEILETISSSGVLKGEPIDYNPFRHRGHIYAICTTKAEKPIKGKQVKFTRLETYYPVQEKSKLAEIASERIEISINPELKVFKKK